MSYAMEILFGHLLAKLGDSNIRLHESARGAVLFSAEKDCFGLQITLSCLRRHLDLAEKGGSEALQSPKDSAPSPKGRQGAAKAKAYGGVLDTVNFLLQHFPGRREDEGDEEDAVATWTQWDIAPFVVGGLDGAMGPRVRNNAVNLAVTVH